jgi:transposase
VQYSDDCFGGESPFENRVSVICAAWLKIGMWTDASRRRMADFERRARRCPTDLTDDERERIRPLMPKLRAREPSVDPRTVLDAIRYMARSGGGWRMLPNDFAPWRTVCWWFRLLMVNLTPADVVPVFPDVESCLRLVRALAVETNENWMEANRYINTDDLRVRKKLTLR